MLIVLFQNKENKPMLLILQMLIPAKAHCLLKFNTLDFAIWARDNVVAVKLDLTDDLMDLRT
jgi:hypothetical protein